MSINEVPQIYEKMNKESEFMTIRVKSVNKIEKITP